MFIESLPRSRNINPSPSTPVQVAAVYSSLSLLRTGRAWHGISRAFLLSLSFIRDPGHHCLFLLYECNEYTVYLAYIHEYEKYSYNIQNI